MYSAIAASSKRRNSDEDYSQDSFKMVHSPESVNEQHLHSVKSQVDKKPPVTNPETMKLYKLFQQEYTIVAEYKMLQSENLHGVYVIPSFENSFLWFGVIFVRSGCYEGGVFRFTVALADTFPDCECPVIAFQSQMFHPAVDPMTGQLSLSEVFPKWTKSNNHIWQILKYVHWIFQNINVKSPANAEALRLFKTNKILFTEKAKESVMLSMDHLYDEPPTDDKHYISFSPYDPSVHDSVKVSMMNSSISPTSSHSQGLSWVQPGTFRPFTKAEEDDESR